MFFHVRRSQTGPWCVVDVTGEIDLATAPRYRAELVAAASSAAAVAVDLTDCDLIDSVGLGVTIGAARRMSDRHGDFAVVVGERSRRAFERSRVCEIVRLVDDLAELGPPAGDESHDRTGDRSRDGADEGADAP